MEYLRRSWVQVAVILCLLSFFSACGGGGGGDSVVGLTTPVTPATTGSTTITGSVSGGTIVAVNESNAEAARSTATTAVAAVAASATKTFSLRVPSGHSYRFYLILNENTLDEAVYPIYQNTATDVYVNVFSIVNGSNLTIDIGLITTYTSPTYIAFPQKSPIVAGVTSGGTITGVPECVLSTLPPAGTSLSTLVAYGLGHLQYGNFLRAKVFFKAAVDNYPGNLTNDGDTARFFYAATRLAGINPDTDGNSADLNSVGDVLDGAGCSAGGRRLNNSTKKIDMTCTGKFSASFPRGRALQTFLYTKVIRPELEAALVNLNGVSSSFSKSWVNPIDNKTYISDYGDALVFKAAIQGTLAAIHGQYAYNLDADIYAVSNAKPTIQAFLSGNADFLKPMTGDYSANGTAAKNYIKSAAGDLITAIDKINTRNTAAYFVNLTNMTTAEINHIKTSLSGLQTSLQSGGQLLYAGQDQTLYTADDVTFQPNLLFSGLNLRTLLPSFTGNTPGYFPSSSMGGVIVSGLNPNEDTNHNGIPDILE